MSYSYLRASLTLFPLNYWFGSLQSLDITDLVTLSNSNIGRKHEGNQGNPTGMRVHWKVGGRSVEGRRYFTIDELTPGQRSIKPVRAAFLISIDGNYHRWDVPVHIQWQWIRRSQYRF